MEQCLTEYITKRKLPVNCSRDKQAWNLKVKGAFKDLKDWHVGATAIVLKKDRLKTFFPEIAKKYPNLSLTVKINKVFVPGGFKADNYIIKNLAWLEGVGPRVYEICKINGYFAQVMEYIDQKYPSKEIAQKQWDEILEKLAKYQVECQQKESYQSNFRGKKLIDFDFFKLSDKKKYLQDLTERFHKTACWGTNSQTSYQDLPVVEIKGSRTSKRFSLLEMDKLDLKGKTVLDLGCSGGQVLYWAAERGADRVVGVDTPEVARVAFEMANLHKYFKIETVGADLTKDDLQKIIKKQTGISKFDIVVMFSVNQHIGFHKYMRDLCKGILYLETNAADLPEVEVKEYPKKLKKLGYKEFKYKGEVNESGRRSLFICR